MSGLDLFWGHENMIEIDDASEFMFCFRSKVLFVCFMFRDNVCEDV